MAIKINITTSNGLTTNYHKVIRNEINWLVKQATVALYMYADRTQRDNYPMNPMDTRIFTWSGADFPFTVDGNNVEQAYEKLVESKKVINVITPAVAEVLDEEGNVITPAVEAVTETVETNEFAGAVEI